MSAPLGFKTIRSNILRDLKNQQPAAHTDADSDNFIRANATASAIEGNYQHQEWILRQAFADTADSDNLERHCTPHGLYRKTATIAGGSVRFTGTAAATVPAGTAIQTANEQTYIVTENTTLAADGTGLGHAISQVTGIAANQTPNTPAKLTSAPVGIDSDCMILTMTGGVDAETDDALLDRLLNKLRQPAAGGNAHDYYVWAMSVPGVTAAYVYPLRRGLGTVDIVIISDNDLPSIEIIAACQAYIDSVRPVTSKDSLVMAPNVRHIDVHVQIRLFAGIDLDTTKQAVTAAITHYFNGLTPAQDLIKSQLEADISNVYGVQDRTMIAPAANVIADVNEQTVDWLRVGLVTVEVQP